MIDDIKKLNKKYKLDLWSKNADEKLLDLYLQFRIDFLQEELDELSSAKSPEDCVDALIDLIVVALGTLDTYNVDINKAWKEVHRANMSKELGKNNTRKNDFDLPDLIKPDNWIEPNHSDNTGKFEDLYE